MAFTRTPSTRKLRTAAVSVGTRTLVAMFSLVSFFSVSFLALELAEIGCQNSKLHRLCLDCVRGFLLAPQEFRITQHREKREWRLPHYLDVKKRVQGHHAENANGLIGQLAL